MKCEDKKNDMKENVQYKIPPKNQHLKQTKNENYNSS